MRSFAVALMLSTFSVISSASEMARLEYFSGKSISFQYGRQDYKSITEAVSTEGADAARPELVYDVLLDRHQVGKGTHADLGTVCLDTMTTCISEAGSLVPYWFDQNGGLRIAGPTEHVYKKTMGGRYIFEAFPLCGWDDESEAIPLGGQCYIAVIPLQNKTVSFTFLLGKADGCKDYDKCWRTQLKKVRRIVESAQ